MSWSKRNFQVEKRPLCLNPLPEEEKINQSFWVKRRCSFLMSENILCLLFTWVNYGYSRIIGCYVKDAHEETESSVFLTKSRSFSDSFDGKEIQDSLWFRAVGEKNMQNDHENDLDHKMDVWVCICLPVFGMISLSSDFDLWFLFRKEGTLEEKKIKRQESEGKKYHSILHHKIQCIFSFTLTSKIGDDPQKKWWYSDHDSSANFFIFDGKRKGSFFGNKILPAILSLAHA
jgi:hypothetical protein